MRGQSLLEYVILVTIIVAALITMQVYMKRGIQGRWKDSVDQLGDQYSPGTTNSVITHRMLSNSETRVQTIRDNRGDKPGYYTVRTDNSVSTETKNSGVQIGY
jgi:Flp pilus assembly pilin Flp